MLKSLSNLFIRLNLSQISLNIYLYILSKSPVSEEELKEAHLNIKNLDQCIQHLIAIPLISIDLNMERKTIYYALKPDIAFKAIAYQELWSYVPTGKSKNSDIKQFISTCEEVGKKLLPQYKQRSSVGLNSIRIARNSDQLSTFLQETISLAEHEILAVSTSPLLPKLSLIWNELKSKIDSGVRYKRITDLQEICYHGYEIKRRDVEEVGIDLRVVETKKIDRKFYIIDDNWLVLFSPDMSKPVSFSLEGQVIKNRALARKFRDYFNDLFSISLSANIVLEYMLITRKNLLYKAIDILDDVGFAWFITLIDYGNFAEWPDLQQTQRDRIIEIAMQHGLVVKESNFKMGVSPNYNWSLKTIKKYQESNRGN